MIVTGKRIGKDTARRIENEIRDIRDKEGQERLRHVGVSPSLVPSLQ